MTKIDNIISIIMVFVTAIGFSRSSGLSAPITVLAVAGAFILYELILNVASNNPSIRTVLYVTMGFIFGLSLAVILDFDSGFLSAFICLLCMGYKYMVAKASAPGPRSRNIFVIFVNGLFYATMFTVIECMAFSQSTPLYVMIYVASFLFILCSYIAYKRLEPEKRTGSRRKKDHKNDSAAHTDVSGDWKHILKRLSGYGRELKEQFEDAIDDSGDTFSGLIEQIRKRIVPDYSDSREEGENARKELEKYRQQLKEIVGREDLTDNETEILNRINRELDEIYYDIYKVGGIHELEHEAKISVMSGDIEMLKNTINIRKLREAEDKEKEETGNRRSMAQQARRRREREERERAERERREREERERAAGAETKDEGSADRDDNKSREDENRRREEERARQEKRRRERSKRTSGSSTSSSGGRSSSAGSGRNSSGSNKDTGSSGSREDDSKVAGIKTKYFKGCTTLDELSLRYKKLCLIYHPDSGNGDADTYIELKEEYETLKKRLS